MENHKIRYLLFLKAKKRENSGVAKGSLFRKKKEETTRGLQRNEKIERSSRTATWVTEIVAAGR